MMKKRQDFYPIVMADDDADDCLLTQEAWECTGSSLPLRFVRDGEELLDYLYHRGKYADRGECPLPSLIILDLHMPKRNGHEVLEEIRARPELQHIPVVMFTSSIDEQDTCRTYALGANACMTKPQSIRDYHFVISQLSKYWSGMVHLPLERNFRDLFIPTRLGQTGESW